MDILIHIKPPVADRPALRLLRCLKRLTQDQLAHRTGISQSTLARLEKGQLPHDRAVCDRLADALGTEARLLFPELNERYEPTEGD